MIFGFEEVQDIISKYKPNKWIQLVARSDWYKK